jgi:acyl carrier protein
VQELVCRVEAWVHQNGSAGRNSSTHITEETDLISDGVLDSIGFIELLQILETESGCRIDLSAVDDFTTIAGLWSAISPSGNGRERS